MNHKTLAIDLAYQAGEIMRNNFSIGMKKEWKQDDTPVTVTDKEINSLVIHSIQKQFPDHAIIGEEESADKEAEYKWVCDPVDGTIPFSHGYPTFIFSLALTKNGESILGVAYDPIMDRLFFAEKGNGATLNNDPIHVSDAKNVKNQMIDIGSSESFIDMRKELINIGAYCPAIFSAVYTSMLTACGEFAGHLYGYNNCWDGAAVKIIVEEAGGKVTDVYGNEQRWDEPIQGYIASNGHLHQQLVDFAKKVCPPSKSPKSFK